MPISCTAPRKPSPHNPIPESQTLPDNPRGGLFLCRASVGEDSILPRGASPQSCILLGEFVQFRTRNHSTKHAETETWREADSLPYSGWAILMDNKKQAAFFYEAACGYLSDFGGFFKGTHCIMGQKICRSPQLPPKRCCLKKITETFLRGIAFGNGML